MKIELEDGKATGVNIDAQLPNQIVPQTFSKFQVVKLEGASSECPREGNLIGDYLLLYDKSERRVGAEDLYQALSKDRTIEQVDPGYMKSSKGLLLCPGLTYCQALIFWDSIQNIAVIAHKNQATDPRDILAGSGVYHGMWRRSESIDQLIPNSSREGVHMAHACIEAWHPHDWVEEAINARGFHNPVSLLKAATRRLHVAVDAQSGLIALMSANWEFPILKQLPIVN